MKDLNDSSTALEILDNLAHCDPVHDATVRPPVPGTPKGMDKSFVKQCALCGAVSGHNEENVTHLRWCPWIPAKRHAKAFVVPPTRAG